MGESGYARAMAELAKMDGFGIYFGNRARRLIVGLGLRIRKCKE